MPMSIGQAGKKQADPSCLLVPAQCLGRKVRTNLPTRASLVAPRHRARSSARATAFSAVFDRFGLAGLALPGLLMPWRCRSPPLIGLRHARFSPRWRLRIDPQVSQDLLNGRPLKDRRQYLQLPLSAVRAVTALTKDYGCDLIISEDALTLAGVTANNSPPLELSLRNRESLLRVATVSDVQALAQQVSVKTRPGSKDNHGNGDDS